VIVELPSKGAVHYIIKESFGILYYVEGSVGVSGTFVVIGSGSGTGTGMVGSPSGRLVIMLS